MSDDLLTARQAGEILGRTGTAVRSYVRSHGLPSVVRDGLICIRRSELDAWRAAPVNAAMLAAGDHTHRRRRLAASA
jgi:hypothetical protein